MKTDGFLLVAIYIIIIMIMMLLVAMSKHLKQWHEEWQVVTEEGWTPREIPECDKALWERITEGCDDEDHD